MGMRSPLGSPTLELFTNSMKHNLDRYISPCPDPKARATDAKTCTWPQEVVMYAYSPQFLMAKLLQRLVQLPRSRVLLVMHLFIYLL